MFSGTFRSMVSPFSWWVGPTAVVALIGTATPVTVLGGVLAARFGRHVRLSAPLTSLSLLVATALVGYVTFWTYYVSTSAGHVLSWALLAATVGVLLHSAERARLIRFAQMPEVATPCLLVVGAALFSLTYSLSIVPGWAVQRPSWVNHTLWRLFIPDASLPLLVARKLHAGASIHEGFLAAGSTARPPLQAGMILMQYPAWHAIAGVLPGAIDVLYESFGVLLQSTWVAGAYAVARLLGFSPRRSALIVVALIPSHFFLLHSVYVWPKLLAGTFVLGVYALLFLRERWDAPVPIPHAVAASIMACLGLLAHPSASMPLLAMALALALPGFFPGWRSVPIVLVVVLALGGPWAAYQMWARPFDYSLTTVFLTSDDSGRAESTWQALRETYGDMTLRDLGALKLQALQDVLGTDPLPPEDRSLWRAVRRKHRRSLNPAHGLLNVGWVLVVLGGRRRRLDGPGDGDPILRTLGVAAWCLTVTLAIMIPPPEIRHIAYGTVVMMFVGLAATIMRAPGWVAGVVLTGHVIVSLLVFGAVLEPPATVTFAWPALLVALSTYLALLGGAWTLPDSRLV